MTTTLHPSDDASPDGGAAADFRVVALISAYNEEDIISQVLSHLGDNGVDSYLIDHHSTDRTVELAKAFLGRGLIGIETFPDDAGFPPELSQRLVWREMLRRKEQLAKELRASWFIHHDADEIRESPFPGLSLKQAIQWVDARGFNCIDFELYNFWPTNDEWQPRVSDPRTHFTHFEGGASYDALQRKAWRSAPWVKLAENAGHDVEVPSRQVFPVRFVLRHYRIRSSEHGRRKIVAERINRFDPGERAEGWHVQYDELLTSSNFVRDPASLRAFDLEAERLRLMLEGRERSEAAAAVR